MGRVCCRRRRSGRAFGWRRCAGSTSRSSARRRTIRLRQSQHTPVCPTLLRTYRVRQKRANSAEVYWVPRSLLNRTRFNTDRGSTYTATDFTTLCRDRLGVRQSMDRVNASITRPRRRSSPPSNMRCSRAITSLPATRAAGSYWPGATTSTTSAGGTARLACCHRTTLRPPLSNRKRHNRTLHDSGGIPLITVICLALSSSVSANEPCAWPSPPLSSWLGSTQDGQPNPRQAHLHRPIPAPADPRHHKHPTDDPGTATATGQHPGPARRRPHPTTMSTQPHAGEPHTHTRAEYPASPVLECDRRPAARGDPLIRPVRCVMPAGRTGA